MFPFIRCVDKCVGSYWGLGGHCKWAGHRCVFRLHPSTGVSLPLRPMCQRHSSRYWVRINTQYHWFFFFLISSHGVCNKSVENYAVLPAAWLVTSTTLSPLHEWGTRTFSMSSHLIRWSLLVVWMSPTAGLFCHLSSTPEDLFNPERGL